MSLSQQRHVIIFNFGIFISTTITTLARTAIIIMAHHKQLYRTLLNGITTTTTPVGWRARLSSFSDRRRYRRRRRCLG